MKASRLVLAGMLTFAALAVLPATASADTCAGGGADTIVATVVVKPQCVGVSCFPTIGASVEASVTFVGRASASAACGP